MLRLVRKSAITRLNRTIESESAERHTLFCKNVALEDKVKSLSNELSSVTHNHKAAFSKLIFTDYKVLGLREILGVYEVVNNLVVITAQRGSVSRSPCEAYYVTDLTRCIADFHLTSHFEETNSYLMMSNFEVKASEQGKKIGTAILKCIEHRASVLNDTITQIEMPSYIRRIVIHEPLSDSIDFYKKCGYEFSPDGTLEKTIGIND